MDEALEDEFYMRRLDAGLFTLQLIDCIIMEVCCSGVTSVKNTITDIFCSFCSFIVHGKVKSAFEGSSPSGRSLFLFRFCSMKRLGVFLLPPDGMLVPRRVTPSIKFAGAYLYTWVERGTVRVKCFAQNTTQCLAPGLEPGPLDPVARALTMRPPCFHNRSYSCTDDFHSFCVF